MTGGPISADALEHLRFQGVGVNSIFRRRMDATGDGSGTKDMATTADEYFILPAVGEHIVIKTIRVVIEDDGDMPWEYFAASGAALVTGIQFRLIENAGSGIIEIKDLLDGEDVTINSDFLGLGVCSLSINVAGRSILTCDINTDSLLGYQLDLDGASKHGLSFNVQDDLSSLLKMQVWCGGVIGTTNR